jgi:hypothetical protein
MAISSSLLNHAQQLSSLVGQFSLGARVDQAQMAPPVQAMQPQAMQPQMMQAQATPQWNGGSNQILESIDSQIQSDGSTTDANEFIEF